jgi:hypothetical protein
MHYTRETFREKGGKTPCILYLDIVVMSGFADFSTGALPVICEAPDDSPPLDILVRTLTA